MSSPEVCHQLEANVSNPGSPQKQIWLKEIWRAQIILLTDNILGTLAIMTGSGELHR